MSKIHIVNAIEWLVAWTIGAACFYFVSDNPRGMLVVFVPFAIKFFFMAMRHRFTSDKQRSENGDGSN